MKIIKLTNLFAFALLLCGLSLSSCDKDDDVPSTPSTSGRKAKITVTTSSTFLKSEGDDFSVSVGGNSGAKEIDWLVNGVKNTGVVVRVGADAFNGGKTIVIESASNYTVGQVNFAGYELGETPFTVTYKIEVNGVVKDQGTKTLSKGDDAFYKTITL